MKKAGWIGVGIIVIVLIIGFSFQNKGEINEIKIGVISPETGTAAAYGEPAAKSVILAGEEINKSGGILGKKVNLITEDGKCEGVSSTNATHKLITIEKVSVILGGHCSTETLTIAPIAEKAKVVVLASITSSPAVTNAGDYIFRNSPSSAFYTAKSADYAYSKGYRRVASLYENKEFPVGAYQTFAGRLEELGGKSVSNTTFNPNENDLRSYILKINQEKPDAIFFASQGPASAVTFFKQMKELGLLDKYPVIGSAQSITPDINTQTGGLLNNPDIFTTDAFVDVKSEKTASFIARYKDAYGTLPPTNFAYLASSYDALYLIKDAMESCKSSTDAECIKAYLYGVKDWSGAAGLLTLDQNGDAITPIGLHYFNEKGEEVWQELE